MHAKKTGSPAKNFIERNSFMLGMITAFAECLAGEAKKLASLPLFILKTTRAFRDEAERICQEQGIFSLA